MLDSHQLITSAELRRLVPFSASYIYRLEKRGQFPKRIKIGVRRIAWNLAEVHSWIATKKSECQP